MPAPVQDPGLFGNAAQRAVAADAPGPMFASRMRGTDDPARRGWDGIAAILAGDGVMALAMIPADRVREAEEPLAARGLQARRWRVFPARAAEAQPPSCAIPDRALPGGARFAPPPGPDGAGDVQDVMATAGVAPVPGAVRLGPPPPAGQAACSR